MKKKAGQCRLCRQDVDDLQVSHLIPKALYKYVKDDGSNNPNPLCVSSERAYLSSRQYTKHLLCGDCEQLLHQRGEDWTLEQLHKGRGRFTLLDGLNSGISSAKHPHAIAYPVSSCPSLRLDQLLHFAIGIFWKYSVTDWNIGDGECGALSLGKVYEENFRHFLLEPITWPTNAVLIVRVFGPEVEFSNSIMLPHGGSCNGFHAHRLIVPGIQFELAIGKQIPAEVRAVATTTNGYIHLTRLPDHIIDLAAPTLKATTLCGKAARD